MTTGQAYHILGIRPGASRTEIEQAYTAALRVLQLQLVPGTPLAVRQRAQDQIAALKTAFERVKNAAVPHVQPPRTGRYRQPQVQPVVGSAEQPRAAGPAALHPVFAVPNPVILASFVLAGIVVLFVVLFCVRSTASDSENRTAQLRVLSVPWSYVEVDGTPLGPSGQIDPFTLKPGEYKLVLCQGGRVLARTISLRENRETVVKAQLEKGQINVVHKPI